MEQIENIRYMEQKLNEATKQLELFEDVLEKFAAVQNDVKALSAYYGSREWFMGMRAVAMSNSLFA